MNIIFALDHIFKTQGGEVYSNTFSYEILRRYVDVFDEVTIVARQRELEDTQEMLLSSGKGVSFVFLESVSSLKSYVGLRQRHKKKLQKIVREHDGVIVKLPSEFGLMTAAIARKEQKLYLVEVVGCAWDAMWNYGGMKSKLYAPYLYYKMKHCVQKAYAVSYVTARFLQERYPSSKLAGTIGLSDVSLPEVNKGILEKRIEKIKALEGKIIFATMANLDLNYKGLDIALKALSSLHNLNISFEYHIAGAGDPTKYKIMAEELGIEDKVVFEGYLSGRDTVFSWLDGVDIYLQPSLVEGLPRALIEAMSRGCPAVGSSVGGIPELLDRSMVFSHTNVEKFQEIILTLLNDKSLMLTEAKENFINAKKYESGSLDAKRKEFLIQFRESITS